jgi:putative membrane protein
LSERAGLLAAGLVVLAWSAVRPHDYFTWLLEVAPILIGVPVLVATRRRFPLTPLVYRLLFVHAVILMIGGHYTYAEVPFGFWLKDAFGFARNHYDRIGHFAQGFVPAILAREILLRRGVVRAGGWLFFLVTTVCLAFSALYELIEWWTALLTGSAATAFLGTQGDPWDTQWDMFLALVGALSSQALLGRIHDRQLT